jgi:DNA-binding Xre family transcriptional regulator
MKIAIKEILQNHFKETGEYITINMLAVEMTNKGIFKNIHSAKNMLYYNKNGKAKGLDIQMLEFLCKRFSKTLNEIII